MSTATMSGYLNFTRAMSYIDLRYAIPIFINLLKFHSESLLWDWEYPFHAYHTHQANWTKLCFNIFMLLLFSAISINVPITPPPPNNTIVIRFQIGNFAPHLTASLVASLVLPRALFWYAYPAILIFALCFSSILFLLRRFLGWVYNKLTALPVWNLHINVEFTQNYQVEAAIDIESQAPLPQVAEEHVSPEDGDSVAEANDEIMVL